MNVAYVAPLRRAVNRAVRMLFRPFQLRTWLVLGFAAFISGYWSGPLGGRYYRDQDPDIPAAQVLQHIAAFLANPLWTFVTIVIVMCALVAGTILLWVSCRGRFVFLDDVVRERAAIVEPWKRVARLGDSLFLWSLVFAVACILIGILMVLPFLSTLVSIINRQAYNWELVGTLAGLFALLIPFGIVVLYINMLLTHFVVPLMSRHNLGVMAAWSLFLGVFRANLLHFVLYGLFLLVLWLVVGIAIVTFGFLSCCVGFILLALPYVGSVLLLPVLVTFRALGIEFLAQFGPEYSLLGTAPGAPPSPPLTPRPTAGGTT